MCHTYFTHSQSKAYLGELIDLGLVDYDALYKKYNTTKSMNYLAALENMNEVIAIETRKAKINT